MPTDPRHDHDRGLVHDLPLIARRRALSLLGGGALGALAGPSLAQDACVALPGETNGPFPADGTNGLRGTDRPLNVLTETGVLREDLRSSFAGMTGIAQGVRLRLELTLVEAAGCGPLARHAIYVWQCDAMGRYSLYELPERNYLRGLAASNGAGRVRFETIFPGCYPGRWPHIHFEVFESVESAATARDSLLISQMALPRDGCEAVYNGGGYGNSAGNLARLDLASDMVFGDNSDAEVDQQTVALADDGKGGFIGTCRIPLAV